MSTATVALVRLTLVAAVALAPACSSQTHPDPRQPEGLVVPDGCQPLDHVVERRRLAAKHMGRAGKVDHQPIGRVGRDNRRVAAKQPQGQPFERGGIGGWIGIADHLSMGTEVSAIVGV